MSFDLEVVIVIGTILGTVFFVFQAGRWYEGTRLRKEADRFDELEKRLANVEAAVRGLQLIQD